LIRGEAKLNILNSPDVRFLSTYSLNSSLKSNFAFIDSLILTVTEKNSLTEIMNNLVEVNLIYRASRDGFEASSFHSKCDNISNTVTIIKTTSDSVFGGFTSASWSSYNGYDANAFIFSLRRSGSANKERLKVTNPDYALFSDNSYGPTFGSDIYVTDYSNQNNYSYSYLGSSYQLPNNLTYVSEESNSYLAGSFQWQTTEIEVYQITAFKPYSVSFLHNGCL
jgi:hypothetical protein